MTVKLAAAMSATRKRTSVVTTSVSTPARTSCGIASPRCGDAPGVTRRTERVDACIGRVDEHRDERGGRERRRWKQHELVAEVARVFDRADDSPLNSVEVDCRAQLETEGVSDAGCDRRLVVGHGITPGAEAEQWLAEGTVRLLRAVVDHLDRAGQRARADARSRRSAQTTRGPRRASPATSADRRP